MEILLYKLSQMDLSTVIVTIIIVIVVIILLSKFIKNIGDYL